MAGALAVLVGRGPGEPEERSLEEKSGWYLEPRREEDEESVRSREARLAALSLADQNAALRQEVNGLKKQVGRLAETLAAVRIEADLYRARLDREALAEQERPAADLDGNLKVLEANPELRMVVVDGGLRRGVRNGLALVVLRNERPVARLVVVDARAEVAGAVVSGVRGGLFPAAGDPVIPARPETK